MKNFFQKLKRFFYIFLLTVFQLSLLSVILFRILPVPFTPLMVQRFIEHYNDTNYHFEKEWTSAKNINVELPLTIVTGEDPKFFNHFGFDFEQIKNSVEKNMEEGKRLRGASTITQQTAKNLFLLPVRSFIRKGIEVYFTILLEAIWNKKRILEVYMNIIETGSGIFGFEAATNHYFKHEAKKINANEAALMTAVLPNPIRWKPNKPDAFILRKKYVLLSLKKYIDKENFWWR